MDQKPLRLRVIRTSGIVVGTVFGVWILLSVVSLLFDKPLWDVLKVLAVPITVGAAVPLLNWLQKKRELDVGNQRAQDAALQAYLDQMSQLLTDNERPLGEVPPGDSLSTVARARTLSVLSRLDGSRKTGSVGSVLRDRKRSVLEFLYESGLIDQDQVILAESNLLKRRHNIVSLEQADLRKVNLSMVNLQGANLQGANLRKADLREVWAYPR